MNFTFKFSFYISLTLFLFFSQNFCAQTDFIQDSKNNSVKVISYNTWGLFIGKGKKSLDRRLHRLSDSLKHYKADIICLQEMFTQRVRKNYIQGIIDEGYIPNRDHLCSKRSTLFYKKDCFGGLVMLSKHPIVRQGFYQFPKVKGMNFFEKRGSKGFQFMIVKTQEGDLCVINTHMYSGRSNKAELIRQHQIEFIDEMITKEKLDQYPIILAGDFNVEHPDVTKDKKKKSTVYPYVINIMEFRDTVEEVTEKMMTYTKLNNIWAPSSTEHAQKLDYIFYKSPNKTIQSNYTEVIFDRGEYLSDHFGLISDFSIQF